MIPAINMFIVCNVTSFHGEAPDFILGPSQMHAALMHGIATSKGEASVSLEPGTPITMHAAFMYVISSSQDEAHDF